MIGYFTDLHMLDHLPYDVRLITDLVNHLRQLPVNIALLERASGLANRYLYSLEINLTVTSAVKVFKHLKVIFEGWIYLSFHILRKKVLSFRVHTFY